ncbi:hypothetical protein T06_3973, partial [Trichinella sp. T6]
LGYEKSSTCIYKGEGGDTSISRSCVCVCMERWLCDSTVPCSNQCTADE